MTFRIATASLALISMMAVGLPLAGVQASPRDHHSGRSHSKVCGPADGSSVDNPSLRCRMQDSAVTPTAQPAPATNWTTSTDDMPPSGGSGVPAFMYGHLSAGHS